MEGAAMERGGGVLRQVEAGGGGGVELGLLSLLDTLTPDDVATIWVIVLLLIVVNFVWELFTDTIEHLFWRNQKHILAMMEVLYKELTIVGIWSVVLFLITATLGISPTLKHVFELIHISLFGLVMSYIFTVIFMALVSLGLFKMWHFLEEMDQSVVEAYYNDLIYQKREKRVKYYAWQLFPLGLFVYRLVYMAYHYYSFRSDFIEMHNLGYDFHFDAYLKRSLKGVFREWAHVHWSVLAVVLVCQLSIWIAFVTTLHLHGVPYIILSVLGLVSFTILFIKISMIYNTLERDEQCILQPAAVDEDGEKYRSAEEAADKKDAEQQEQQEQDSEKQRELEHDGVEPGAIEIRVDGPDEGSSSSSADSHHTFISTISSHLHLPNVSKKKKRRKKKGDLRSRSAPERVASGEDRTRGRYRQKAGSRRQKAGSRRRRRSKDYEGDSAVMFESDDDGQRYGDDAQDRDFVIDLVDEPARKVKRRHGGLATHGSLASLLATPVRLLGSDSSSSDSSSIVDINSSESWVSTWSSSWESTWTSVSGSSSESEVDAPPRVSSPALSMPESKASAHSRSTPHHHHHHHIHRHTHHHHVHHTTNKHHRQSDLIWLTKLLIPMMLCKINPITELLKWFRNQTAHEKLFWMGSPYLFLYLCQVTLFWQACLIALTVGGIFGFLSISWIYLPFAIAILAVNLCYFMPAIVYMYSICTNIGQFTKMEYIHQVHAKPHRKQRATKQEHMKPHKRPRRRRANALAVEDEDMGSDGSAGSSRSMKELRAVQDEQLAQNLPPHPRTVAQPIPVRPTPVRPTVHLAGGHHHHVQDGGGARYDAPSNRPAARD